MKIEEQNVMKFSIGKTGVYYRVACDCKQPECDMELSLEKDEDFPGIYCTFTKTLRAFADLYSEAWLDGWGWADFIRIFKNKLILCWKIIFTGKIEVSEVLILRNKTQISNLLLALMEGRSFLEEMEKGEQNEKKSC